MVFNKDNARRDLYYGIGKGYSHLVVLLDKWEYEYLTIYISKEENIDDILKQYIYQDSLWVVVEIYNYDMDLELQLRENKPMHKEIITKNNYTQKTPNILRNNNPLIDFISSLDKPSEEERAFFDSLESSLIEHQKRLRK